MKKIKKEQMVEMEWEIEIPQDLYQKMVKLCKKLNLTLNEFVTEAMENFLSRNKTKE
jgi:predicted DNA-binding protein